MDAIITVDEAQRVVLFNPAAERMFGIAVEEALGEPISRFIPERNRAGHGAHICAFLETGVRNRRMAAQSGVSGLRANGEEFSLEASISQVDLEPQKLATVFLRDITQRKANEGAIHLLAREVDHRAKNALAVCQALVSLTRAATKEEFVAAVRGRVSALGRAHSLLAQNRWEGADLAKIVADETEPYQRPGQIRISGPPIALGPNAVQPLSMLIHELATNAVKYGALSVERGRIDIRFTILPSLELELRWNESGGPPVTEPKSKGFGSTLIKEVTTRQLYGSLDVDWPTDGMQLTAILPPEAYRAESATPRPALAEADQVWTADEEAGRVLIVEDEPLIALELRDLLTAQGWVVVGPAATVKEAFKLLENAAPVDVAVLDVNLGGALVYPLAERLQEEGVPFVFCTGYVKLDCDERFDKCPVVGKPVNVRQLTDEMKRVRHALDDRADAGGRQHAGLAALAEPRAEASEAAPAS